MSAEITAVLRCDAGPAIGAGHLVRCVALAEGLRREGAAAALVTRPLPAVWRELIRSRGIEHLEREELAPGVLGEQVLAIPFGGPPAMVILDDYGFGAEEFEAAGSRAGLVVRIADRGGDLPVDAVIDHNLGAREQDYSQAGLRLIGPGYALLREEFRNPPPRPSAGCPASVLISLGGSASATLLPHLLGALEEVGTALRVRIVGNPYERGKDLAREGSERLELSWIPPRPSLIEELCAADLALLAAGGIRFEAARCGCPMVLGILADNQIEDARAFARAGAAELVGWWKEAGERQIATLVRELLGDDERRVRLAHTGRQLVDGRGAARTARALIEAVRHRRDGR